MRMGAIANDDPHEVSTNAAKSYSSCYSTISTMRRLRGSTSTVRPFTTV
jgi:hypothetical protein